MAFGPPEHPKSSRWPWRILAILLLLTSSGLHLAYFTLHCPLDLAPDEAHYWDWSRHLDWSYYSKGPLVAYLIRGSCELVGPWSESLIGNEMIAVRLPAVLCGSLLLASWYVLTVQVFGRDRLALAVVALALTLPLINAGASLMTIDAPYTCCWGWALVCGHRAVFRRSAWAWPLTGLLVGLGILAKYTMVLWLPSLGLFLCMSPTRRGLLKRPGFWIMMAVAGLCCLPILAWNVRHDWASLRHVSGQAGVHQQFGIRWGGPFLYLASQAGLMLGFWFVVWVVAMVAHRPGKESDPALAYLWWMSAPVFTVFFVFSFMTAEEPNWPVAAYVSSLVLAVAWVARQLQSPGAGYRRFARICLTCSCVLGLGVTILMHHSDWARPVLLRLSGPPTAVRKMPLRRFDPTCRLRGWRFLAKTIDGVRNELQSKHIKPVLVCTGWTFPGEVGFYCQGHPTVYTLGPVLADRHSQYDFWRPNPVHDAGRFKGRTFVLVGEFHPILRKAFRKIDRSRPFTYAEGGQPIAQWTITVCREFLGSWGPLPRGNW
jgi:hypothetical protein